MLESEKIYTVSQLAQHNAGVTFITESFVAYMNQNLTYNLYPVNVELIPVDFFIAYQRNRQLSEFDETFIRCFQNCFE